MMDQHLYISTHWHLSLSRRGTTTESTRERRGMGEWWWTSVDMQQHVAVLSSACCQASADRLSKAAIHLHLIAAIHRVQLKKITLKWRASAARTSRWTGAECGAQPLSVWACSTQCLYTEYQLRKLIGNMDNGHLKLLLDVDQWCNRIKA